MGFFQDLKEDLSMAVNELIPEENLDNQPNEDVSAAISEQEAINADAFRAAVERLDDEFPTVEIPEEAAQMMAAAQEAEIPQMEAVPEEAMPKLPEMQELPAMEEPEPAADPAMQELWNQVPTEEEGVSLDELVAVAEAAAVSAGEEIPFAKQAEAPVMPEAPVQAASVMPEAAMQQAPVMPEAPVQAAPVMPEAPVQAAPVMEAPVQAAPVMPEAPVQAAPVMPEAPVQAAPVMPEAPVQQAPVMSASPQEALIRDVVTEITDPTPQAAQTTLEAQVTEAITQAPAFVLEGEPVDETAVITAGMMIRGDIASHGSLEIEGDVYGNVEILGKLSVSGNLKGSVKAAEVFTDAANLTGDIHTAGSAKIGKDSVIIGNVFATSAVIAGAVKGDIDVHGPVILDTSAVVMGNIKSKSVQINNGAVIEGMCSQAYADVSPASFFDRLR